MLIIWLEMMMVLLGSRRWLLIGYVKTFLEFMTIMGIVFDVIGMYSEALS